MCDSELGMLRWGMRHGMVQTGMANITAIRHITDVHEMIKMLFECKYDGNSAIKQKTSNKCRGNDASPFLGHI